LSVAPCAISPNRARTGSQNDGRWVSLKSAARVNGFLIIRSRLKVVCHFVVRTDWAVQCELQELTSRIQAGPSELRFRSLRSRTGRLVGRIFTESAYLPCYSCHFHSVGAYCNPHLNAPLPRHPACDTPRLSPPAVPCIAPSPLAPSGLDQSLCAHLIPRFLPARCATDAVEHCSFLL
jgi:hypothetical protein